MAEEMLIFGCSEEDLAKSKPEFYSNNLYAMAILSDAQEEIVIGRYDLARKFINRAKFFISTEIKNTEVKQ